MNTIATVFHAVMFAAATLSAVSIALDYAFGNPPNGWTVMISIVALSEFAVRQIGWFASGFKK